MPIDTYPAPVQGTSGAVLGYAEVTTAQTGITSEVDLTGLVVTVTVPAGRRLRITGAVRADASVVNSGIAVYILEPGVGYLQSNPSYNPFASTAMQTLVTTTVMPTAGTHTYKLTGAVSGSGTAALRSAAGNPSWLLVEDITGGTGGPGPIQLGYAELASTATLGAIAGETDVPGLSVTVNVPAGRRIRVRALVHLRSATAADVLYSRLRVDGGNLGFAYLNENATLPTTGMIEAVHTPTAGTHTYKVAANRASGTGSVSVYSAITSDSDKEVSFIVVEDITGTPSPAGIMPTSQTLAYAEVQADQAGITTATDLTGLTITISVPSGRRIKITGRIAASSSVASDVINSSLYEGATELQQGRAHVTVGGSNATIITEAMLTPSAGIHTYKLSLSRFAGTGTLTMASSAVRPAFLLAEDVTGGAPALQATSVPVGVLAQAQTTTAQTGITTLVDLTGLSVNVVVPAGRTLKITGQTYLYTSTTNDEITMSISEGATVLASIPSTAPLGGRGWYQYNSVIVSPSAGAHTYKLQGAVTSGAGTVTNNSAATRPSFIVVEDITPTPAPATTAPSSTLGYAEITANQTGILSTDTAITGLSVTVTVPAGRRLRISTYGQGIASGAIPDRFFYKIFEDSTVIGQAQTTTDSTTLAQRLESTVVRSPSAGTHTYAAKLAIASGAGTFVAGTGDPSPAYILVEDITPVALSTQGVIDTTPIATVSMTAATLPPSGWMLCDGSAISRTGYPALFSAVGTTYGTGDGSTTFNVPNLKGRVVVGYDASQTEFNAVAKTGGVKTMTANEMPTHTHTQNGHNHGGNVTDPGFTPGVVNNAPVGGGTGVYQRAASQALFIPTDTAVNQNAGTGAAGGNLPPYMAMNYIIKAV